MSGLVIEPPRNHEAPKFVEQTGYKNNLQLFEGDSVSYWLET